MLSEHPIQGLMKTTMDSIKEMIDVNTIVGDAVETPNGSVIMPISRVSFGFAAGGSEFEGGKTGNMNDGDSSKLPFGGGSGAGVSVQPVAFLVVGGNEMRLLPVNYNNMLDRIIDMVPNVVDNIEKVSNRMKNKPGNTVNNTVNNASVPPGTAPGTNVVQ